MVDYPLSISERCQGNLKSEPGKRTLDIAFLILFKMDIRFLPYLNICFFLPVGKKKKKKKRNRISDLTANKTHSYLLLPERGKVLQST